MKSTWGTASPFNFNGLVRHYYLRQGANMADIQVNLASKGLRKDQSHAIAKRIRPALKGHCESLRGARVKIAEVPPGPPVLSTLVAEIYGPDYNPAAGTRGRRHEDLRGYTRGCGCGLVHGRRSTAIPGQGGPGKGGAPRGQRSPGGREVLQSALSGSQSGLLP